jgi:hypothetical protein
MIWLLNTNRNPPAMLVKTGVLSAEGGSLTRMENSVSAAHMQSMVATT